MDKMAWYNNKWELEREYPGIKELIHPMLGLDILAFEERYYPNIPDGISLSDAIKEKHGNEDNELGDIWARLIQRLL